MLAALLCCICHCPSPPVHPLRHLCPHEAYIDGPCLHRPARRWWDCGDRVF